jgi:hypothetical protein
MYGSLGKLSAFLAVKEKYGFLKKYVSYHVKSGDLYQIPKNRNDLQL